MGRGTSPPGLLGMSLALMGWQPMRDSIVAAPAWLSCTDIFAPHLCTVSVSR